MSEGRFFGRVFGEGRLFRGGLAVLDFLADLAVLDFLELPELLEQLELL